MAGSVRYCSGVDLQPPKTKRPKNKTLKNFIQTPCKIKQLMRRETFFFSSENSPSDFLIIEIKFTFIFSLYQVVINFH